MNAKKKKRKKNGNKNRIDMAGHGAYFAPLSLWTSRRQTVFRLACERIYGGTKPKQSLKLMKFILNLRSARYAIVEHQLGSWPSANNLPSYHVAENNRKRRPIITEQSRKFFKICSCHAETSTLWNDQNDQSSPTITNICHQFVKRIISMTMYVYITSL